LVCSSTSGGRILHAQLEDAPCHVDKDPHFSITLEIMKITSVYLIFSDGSNCHANGKERKQDVGQWPKENTHWFSGNNEQGDQKSILQ
jgi:hypothetical protein